MSDHFLVVIPADPAAALPDTANELRDALAKFAGSNEARVKDYGKLKFIDCGENFESVSCPACKSALPIDWWRARMDDDWHGEDGFQLHAHILPCCSAKASLNDLIYDFPQGFARWLVAARNPGRPALTVGELSQLEAVAGLGLKAIAQMY